MTTTAVTKCDLIPPPALVFCTQTDTWTDRQTDRVIPVYPKKHLFCGGMIMQ